MKVDSIVVCVSASALSADHIVEIDASVDGIRTFRGGVLGP